MSGIYLHIPFCKQACYYCDFHFSTSLRKKEEMIRAIAGELIMRAGEVTGKVETVYFGGGTPSLLSASEIDGLLELIHEHFTLGTDPEITLEANPDDLTRDKIVELSGTGVNRLSIGIQSFFDSDLRYMNRAHSADEAIESLELAKRFFDNISIDLIYGVPGLSEEHWRKNLDLGFDPGIKHVSSYALTVEPKTALDHLIRKGKCQAPNEEMAARHFEILREVASDRGYVQYEVSNFGKAGFFSRHNTSYWKGVPYMGVGPSAHSYDGRSRSWNVTNNAKYLRAIQDKRLPSESEMLFPEDMINESVMTGLRTIWGVSLADISAKFGVGYTKMLLDQADKHLKEGRLYVKDDRLYLWPRFYFFADGISSDLFLLKVSDI